VVFPWRPDNKREQTMVTQCGTIESGAKVNTAPGWSSDAESMIILATSEASVTKFQARHGDNNVNRLALHSDRQMSWLGQHPPLERTLYERR
jgi:hypothetical protein